MISESWQEELFRVNGVSAVLTTLVASILGADIAMAGGPSVSRVTNYVSNTMENGGGDHSYSTQLSSLSVTTLTYIFGAVMAITGLIIIIGLVQYVIGSFVSLGLIQYNLDLIDGRMMQSLVRSFQRLPCLEKHSGLDFE